MPVYLFYDKKSGEILHIHREIYMDSGRTVELNPGELLDGFKDLLPPQAEAGVLTLENDPERQRGYRYYVDTGTRRLCKVARPLRQKGVSR